MSGLIQGAGKKIAGALVHCSAESKAYAKCCVSLQADISQGACAKEMQALMACFSAARKKIR